MIVLQGDALLVRLDPAHGAEALDLVDRASGRQLLAHTPWRAAAPHGGELREDAWTAAWRGGWQPLLPNAGNRCEVEGVAHGFHGCASVDPWAVEDVAADRAALTWRGHGLTARRTYAVVDGALRVETSLACAGERPAPFLFVEHVALGLGLLDKRSEVTLPPARAFELDADGGPLAVPDNATTWPRLRRLDGSVESVDRLALEPRARMAVLADLPHGWAAVRNAESGQGLAFSWDLGAYPHLWLYHEVSEPDAGGGRMAALIVEPASLPHHGGLAQAIATGHARWLAPGERFASWVTLRPFRSDAPVAAVDADSRVR